MKLARRPFSMFGTRYQRGVSLVELLVAIVIGLILTGGIIQLYVRSKQSYNTLEALAAMQENGRFSIDTIARDLRRSGYWGGNADITDPTTSGTEPPVTPDNTCNTGDTSWARMVSRRIFGVDDYPGASPTVAPSDDPGASMGACISAASQLRGDVMGVRYASPSESAAFDANRLYMRSSLFAGRIFVGSKQANVENEITAEPRRTAELIAHAYYIRPSVQTCRGEAVPALWRVTLNENGQPASEEIALGVEQLQVQYGIDSPVDAGSVNKYVNADAIVDWDQVVAARVWLLVRSECPQTGYTDGNTYAMGNIVYDPADDSHLRQLYVTTVMLRNPKF